MTEQLRLDDKRGLSTFNNFPSSVLVWRAEGRLAYDAIDWRLFVPVGWSNFSLQVATGEDARKFRMPLSNAAAGRTMG